MADEATGSSGVTGVARDTIGALRTTPVLLVLVLLNVGFLAVAAYYFRAQQANALQLVQLMLNRCLPDVHGDAYIVPPGGQVVVPDTPKPVERLPEK